VKKTSYLIATALLAVTAGTALAQTGTPAPAPAPRWSASRWMPTTTA